MATTQMLMRPKRMVAREGSTIGGPSERGSATSGENPSDADAGALIAAVVPHIVDVLKNHDTLFR
jgi:hypothetical protein